MKLAMKIISSVVGFIIFAKLVQYAIDFIYEKCGRHYISAE
ncbi:MAG: hypothetical protein K0R90_610 [Oscillospiraceae bacterium]|jgi:hypothetical protein|nr:hypothetical protein [Oscillospiraceae bacterium]